MRLDLLLKVAIESPPFFLKSGLPKSSAPLRESRRYGHDGTLLFNQIQRTAGSVEESPESMKKGPSRKRKGPGEAKPSGISGRGSSGEKYGGRNPESLRQEQEDLQRGHPASPLDGGKVFLGYAGVFREFFLSIAPLKPELPNTATVKSIHANLLGFYAPVGKSLSPKPKRYISGKFCPVFRGEENRIKVKQILHKMSSLVFFLFSQGHGSIVSLPGAMVL